MAPTRFNLSGLIACPDCDMLLMETSLPNGHKMRCPRCQTIVRISITDSVTKTLAMSMAGLLIYIPAMIMPIMTFSIAGLKGSGNVIDAFSVLVEKGYYFVGIMVLLTSIVFPLLKLSLLFFVSLSIKIRRFEANLPSAFKAYNHLSEWGMVEVYMLGILISIIKMHKMAQIQYDVGFFCFCLLVMITTASSLAVDAYIFWKKIETNSHPTSDKTIPPSPDTIPLTARMAGIIRCQDCGKLVYATLTTDHMQNCCPRCHSALHMRKPDSLNRTWAMVITAAFFLLPANLLPIMRVDFLGTPEDSTILDGIIYFFQTGEYGIGAIILTASILVPMFKVVGIFIILLSIRFKRKQWLVHKTTMFHFIEFIGRWSFLDIFVIALLGALVQFGALTTIEAAPAAPFFTAAVVTTMIAALIFDPRILWDTCAPNTSISSKEIS